MEGCGVTPVELFRAYLHYLFKHQAVAYSHLACFIIFSHADACVRMRELILGSDNILNK